MSGNNSEGQDHKLRRVIGLRGVTAACFNCVVGVGIFGLPAAVAGVLGPAAILAYGVCLVLMALIGLCLAEAGSRVSTAGGLYAYARAAYGPVLSGVAGMLLLFFNLLASSAALARFAIDALASIWPQIGNAAVSTVLLAVLFGGLAAVNVRGARQGANLTSLMALIKIIPLVLIVAIGMFAIDPTKLAWPSIPTPTALGQGAVVLIFAFFGLESGLITGAETKDPARNIPRAIGLTLGIVAVLYVGLQTVSQGVLGDKLPNEAAPLGATATAVFGPQVAAGIVGLAAVSAIGYLVADALTSPRVLFALGEARQLPRMFARVHPRYETPAVAIVVYATVAFILAISGTFRELVILATSGTLILYLMCCLGVLRMRAKRVAMAGPPFIAPGGPIVPLAASALILVLLWTLSWRELMASMVAVAVSATIYFFLEKRKDRIETQLRTSAGSPLI
ncbi:MAG: APC family permease [Alphaproteobacteria bacterium]|nr:MAG: APC family permease [Alphaproteobacteria bacterium]